jgi:hypothetical protein
MSEHEFFDLPCFLVPREETEAHYNEPCHDLKSVYCQGVLPFRIHPDLLHSHADGGLLGLEKYDRGESIPVIPTASTRTVLTYNHPHNHFIKLHMPKRISRFNRRLRTSSIEHSVGISRDLDNMRLDGFAHLPECIGIAYGGADGFGFIIRETEATPYIPGGHLIPYFALYSQDTKNPKDKPLLVQMIEQRGEEPAAFLSEEILIPLIECWCRTLSERGILLESHGQNTLLEIDSDLKPRRIVHRDFQSSMVDPLIRGRNGLSINYKKHLIEVDGFFRREQEYSLVYDYLMGHHLFDELAGTLSRFYNIDVDAIREPCKDAFRKFFSSEKGFFPDTMFNYVSRAFPDNIPELEDSKRKPEWR